MELVFTLPPDRRTPARARARLAELADAVEPGLLPRLTLVVSELVTNAVRHAPGSEVEVRLVVEHPRRVRGEVVDDGRGGRPEPREQGGPDGGFGLHIVEDIAAEWGVHEGSTHVWFVLEDDEAA